MTGFVRLDQFESCVRRWRFGAAGQFSLTLFGGTMADKWEITVSQGAKSLRLVVPRGP